MRSRTIDVFAAVTFLLAPACDQDAFPDPAEASRGPSEPEKTFTVMHVQLSADGKETVTTGTITAREQQLIRQQRQRMRELSQNPTPGAVEEIQRAITVQDGNCFYSSLALYDQPQGYGNMICYYAPNNDTPLYTQLPSGFDVRSLDGGSGRFSLCSACGSPRDCHYYEPYYNQQYSYFDRPRVFVGVYNGGSIWPHYPNQPCPGD